MEDIYNDENEYSGPSKSQLKREMTALQDLGAELVELSRERLAKIEMPERLRDALLDAQRFTKHEARRRQMQYIGKIMRDIDAAPLRAAMDEIKGVSEAANIRQHQLERLRTRLMEDEAVFSEVARDYPVQSQCYALSEATKHFFVKDSDHPYSTPADKPFTWIRGYHVGGRSIMWGLQSYRLSPMGFEANAPILPSPRTAVPFEITATRLRFAV